MRWTKRSENGRFYVIIKKDIFIYDIVQRICDIETEMCLADSERWTNGNVLKGNIFEHVYELIQRLGELEDDVLRFRQRKKIHERIQSINK